MIPPSKEDLRLVSINLAALLEQQRATKDLRLEMYESLAAELKEKYDALINAGFTPDQALILLKEKAL